MNKLVSTCKGHNYLKFLNTVCEIHLSSIAQPKLQPTFLFLLTNQESFKFASERNRNFRDSKSNN